MASSTAVPVGFHYETKYVVLSYLGLLSQEKPQEQHPPSTQDMSMLTSTTATRRQPLSSPLGVSPLVCHASSIHTLHKGRPHDLKDYLNEPSSSTIPVSHRALLQPKRNHTPENFGFLGSNVLRPQQSVIPQALAKEVLEKLKTEIEEELKHLDEEILEAFTSTGFDCHTSPVFSPANPESSIEDCLAHLGEKVSQELKEPLHKALQILLSKPVTYQEYRECTQETDAHASGWSKVLVPLVLLQQFLMELTKRGQEPLGALLQFGVTYLEDYAADYIIQQGGWGTVFSLDSEEEEYHAITAEDSNDIYILTSENSGQVSPPESPTVTTSWQSESLPVSLSASQSWHTESLPVSLGPESWQQVAMDPEEVKSLDSNGGGEERSENNSSNSDIVHVEKEEIPEGIEEVAVSSVALETETAQEGFLESPSLLEMKSEAEIVAVEKASPSAPLLTEHEEEGEVAEEPFEPEISMLSKPVQKPTLSEEKAAPEPEKILPPEGETKVGKESHSEEKSPAGEEKPILLPEGKSILLYGGAAAVAILAVAVGVALALRKK